MIRPALLTCLALSALIIAVACSNPGNAAPSSKKGASKHPTTQKPASKPATTKASTRAAITPPKRAGDPKSAEEAAMMMATKPTTNPVPLLTADETLKTFKLPPGFRIEVVAEEPLVQHPVAMAFAPDGKIWVCEMRGYMPNVEGTGETKPNGRVSALEDTDGDGRMDKSTVFWDGIVLPRAISLVRDGVLVAVPPNVWYCKDTDGDGRSDSRRSIAQDYGVRGNVEHQPNGLIHGLDNWLYNADYDKRFRLKGKEWLIDEYEDSGQWGISQDDWGRLFTNNNSNYLRMNYVAPHYLVRNPHFRPAGVNVEVDHNQLVWPAHATAINRGYRPGILREDGTLKNFTGACSPLVYRGGLFGPEFDSNVFVSEVTANVIRRAVLTEKDGVVTGKNAYDQAEFLTSTYERFRPVSLYNGPEGALYICDMHHGLIQHREYETPYLREQYLARDLEKYLRTGRIYRVVPDNGPTPKGPNLAKATSEQLVQFLADRNGFVRDMSQQLLVERNDEAALSPLREMAAQAENPLARVHALWTLEGMGNLSPDVLIAALKDTHGKVRANAIRLSETFMPQDTGLTSEVLKLSADEDADVQLQFALSVSAVNTPDASAAVADVVTAAADSQYVRDAAMSGMKGRELEFLERLLNDDRWAEKQNGRDVMLAVLTRCVMAEGKPDRVMRLTDLIASQTAPTQAWRQLAMVESFPEINPKRPVRNVVKLTTRPSSLDALSASPDQKVREGTVRVAHVLMWPGKRVNSATRRSLSQAEQDRFDAGRIVYAQVCGNCHKPDGMGQAGLAPPLVDSDWVLGDQQRLIKIVLHGLRGPVKVNDQVWELDMPHLRILSDKEIASVLTYVRHEWLHDASSVTPQDVAKLRERYKDRVDAWTAQELTGAEPAD
jgi:mono/diheme cytochrome c family protein/glucose/arabinose dehydrogenase